MGFAEAVRTCLTKYATFTGRARRSEYWWFTLAGFLAGVATSLLDAALGTQFIYLVTALALFLPSLAVTVRRLHDTGRSGWWLLIAFIPIVGFIVLLVWWCQDSEARDNEYGPWPKHTPEALGQTW